MPNIGFIEMLVIGVAVLLVFGPKRLPELAKGVGKGIRDFKKALSGEEDSEKSKEALPPEQKNAQLAQSPQSPQSDVKQPLRSTNDDSGKH